MTAELPRARPELVLDEPVNQRRIVYDPVSREYYRMGLREAAFLEGLDGTRTPAQLGGAEEHGFTVEEVSTLLDWFASQGLLEGSAPAPVRARLGLDAIWRMLMRPHRLRIPLVDPNAALDRLRGPVDALFSRPALGLYLLSFLSPAVVYFAAPQRVRAAMESFHLPQTTTDYVALYGLLIGMNIVHEMSHALACKHFGGRVHRIGLMFMYLHPVLFCDVSDSWRFRSANQKMVVAAAGIFSQFVLAPIAIAAWMTTGVAVLATFAVVSMVVGLLNFFPLVKLDGYWVLVHWLNEPNLRQRGVEAVDLTLRRWLGRADPAAKPPFSHLIFGVGHLLVTPVFWLLGLLGVYLLGSRFSPRLGVSITAAVALALAGRWSGDLARYLGSFRAPTPADEH